MKTLVSLLAILFLTSCVESGDSQDSQVTTHQLKCGERVAFYTCTGSNCYVLTAPMGPGYVPQTYKLYNERKLGNHFEEFRECQ